MDVNIYIKNMIELELIKKIIFKNDKQIISMLNYFKPALKNDYSQKYNDKLSKLYSNKFYESEIEEYMNSIKDLSLNSELLNEIRSYYNTN